jgi:hypothetical protein
MNDTNPATGRERWSRVELGGYAAELDQGDDGEWIWWVFPSHIAPRAFDALDINTYFADENDIAPDVFLHQWQEERT